MTLVHQTKSRCLKVNYLIQPGGRKCQTARKWIDQFHHALHESLTTNYLCWSLESDATINDDDDKVGRLERSEISIAYNQ